MPKRRRADDFDGPWKDALQFFLRQFLAFFFVDIHDDIDWERGYDSLDKEFQQIVRRAKVGKRLADKLFKVWLRNGAEKWLLIHVEIQGEGEDAFPERMFNYNTAVWKLYRRDVVSLAMLCDEVASWRPTSFAYGQWGCRTEVVFRIAKLLDFLTLQDALEHDKNAFAIMVLAHLKAIATRHDPDSRRDSKFRLVKLLLRSKLPKEDLRQLIRLVDWMLTLPDDLEEAFQADLSQLEEEDAMEYITSFERIGYKRGREEGREEGREIGRDIGREEGLRLGLLESIQMDLESRFGAAGLKLLTRANAIPDADTLRRFAKIVKDANNLREVREFFA